MRLHHLFKYSLVKRINSDQTELNCHLSFSAFVCLRWQRKTRTTGTILTIIKHRCSNPCKGIAAYLVAVQCAELDKKTKNENNGYQSYGQSKRVGFFCQPLSKCSNFTTCKAVDGVTRLHCNWDQGLLSFKIQCNLLFVKLEQKHRLHAWSASRKKQDCEFFCLGKECLQAFSEVALVIEGVESDNLGACR